MTPAFSLIFFTTASGAGYGLFALLAIAAGAGVVPDDPWFGFAVLAFALALITAGLLSSTFHLGHPERAWRALSQWRSSWLSREGMLAIFTYFCVAAFGIGWVFLDRLYGWVVLAGLTGAALAAATVACTGMIYASLRTVRQWHNRWVVPNYLALALMTGALWLNTFVQLWGERRLVVEVIAAAAVPLAAWLKERYWNYIDTTKPASTPETATGLGALGAVRRLDEPHTSRNFLLDEMGFRIARKHALRLRRIALGLGFALPLLLSLVVLVSAGWLAALAALIAGLAALAGVAIERWLFFAEAEHTVMLYYGAPRP